MVAFLAFALAPTAVLAKANPNNHGHHYGQLKHHHRTPAPPPVPPASAAPKSAPGATTLARPAPKAATVLPPVAVPLPGELVPAPMPPARGLAIPFRDRNLWLVVALLPSLIVIWLLVAGRLGADQLNRRKRLVPIPA